MSFVCCQVAAVEHSTEYRLGVLMNAKVNTSTYTREEYVLAGTRRGGVGGFSPHPHFCFFFPVTQDL